MNTITFDLKTMKLLRDDIICPGGYALPVIPEKCVLTRQVKEKAVIDSLVGTSFEITKHPSSVNKGLEWHVTAVSYSANGDDTFTEQLSITTKKPAIKEATV